MHKSAALSKNSYFPVSSSSVKTIEVLLFSLSPLADVIPAKKAPLDLVWKP